MCLALSPRPRRARRAPTGRRRLGPPRAGRPAEGRTGPPTLSVTRYLLDGPESGRGAPPPARDGRAPSRGADRAPRGGRARPMPQFTRLWLRQSCLRAVPAFLDSCLRTLLKANLNRPTFKLNLQRSCPARAATFSGRDPGRAVPLPTRAGLRWEPPPGPRGSFPLAGTRCARCETSGSPLPGAFTPPSSRRAARPTCRRRGTDPWEPRGGHA